MNYPFRDAIVDFLTQRIDAYAFSDRLAVLCEDYPKPFLDACLNLIGSHDVERVITALAGAPDARTLTREQQLAYAADDAAWETAEARFLAATALQCCFPGVPCIYYGDEVGMRGMRDPLNRATYPWGNQRFDLFARVKDLLALRQDPIFTEGQTRFGAIGAGMFALVRYTETDASILLVNAGDAEHAILFPALLFEGTDKQSSIPFAGTYRSSGGTIYTANASLTVPVPQNGVVLLQKIRKDS